MSTNPLFSERKVGDKFLRRNTLGTYLAAPTLQKSAAMHKEALPFLLSAPLLAAGVGLGAYGLYKDVPNLYRSIKKGETKNALKDAGLVGLDTMGFIPGASMLSASLRGSAAANKAIQAGKGVNSLGEAVKVGQAGKNVNQAQYLTEQAKMVGDASKAKSGWWNYYTRDRMAQRMMTDAASHAKLAAPAAQAAAPTGVAANAWAGAKMPFQATQDTFRYAQYAPMYAGRKIAPGMQGKIDDWILNLSKTRPGMALELANRPEIFMPTIPALVFADPALRKSRAKGQVPTQSMNPRVQQARLAYNAAAPLAGTAQM
jgi:hypothetical protein